MSYSNNRTPQMTDEEVSLLADAARAGVRLRRQTDTAVDDLLAAMTPEEIAAMTEEEIVALATGVSLIVVPEPPLALGPRAQAALWAAVGRE